MSTFSPEELAELGAFDAAIDAERVPRGRYGPKRRDLRILARVGREIVARRRQIGLTQAGLAAAAGLSPQVTGRYELGKASPSITALYLIATALSCRPGDLLPPAEGDD